MEMNGKTKGIAFLLAAFFVIRSAAGVPVSGAPAFGTEEASGRRRDLTVLADGVPYPGEVRLEHGTAWVSLREFALFADEEAEVLWDGESRAASVRTECLTLRTAEGERVVSANGRLLWCPAPTYIDGAVLYVPLRQIGAAFGYACRYEEEGPAALLKKVSDAVAPPGREEEEDLFWLARIIEAEAGAEPFLGKLAVGAVVVNRVASDEFPDTVRGVIFDTGNGVQFTPAENGSVWRDPGEDSIRAARITLDNPPLWEDVAYFLNPAKAVSLWIQQTREYVFSVGEHEFYR